MSEPQDKPFDIPKRLVLEAYERVKANKGAAGADGQSIEDFESDLRNNLYKIWNRMSSGTYFPPPVMAVEIPKTGSGGGTRILGVPTVADRVAQTVAALALEARTESIFHDDSYGYRPRRSALDAVAKCRQRCWNKDWVIDLDVARFFDSVPWDLMVKAVQANITTGQKWVLLYVKRWLAAPVQQPGGTLAGRDRGTPQGGLCSAAHNPALRIGVTDFARAGEPVHALRVRYLARPQLSGRPVRAVRRRRGRALRHRAPGPRSAGGAAEQDGTGRAAAAPGQDPDRVLQCVPSAGGSLM